MLSDTQTIILVIAVIVGVIARTLVPYLKKVERGEVTGFDWKYAASALFALILTAFTAISALAGMDVPIFPEDFIGYVSLFSFGLTYAWAFQSVANYVVDLQNA